MDTKDLLKRVKEDKIKFISYQFTDINGVVKSLDGPADRLEESITTASGSTGRQSKASPAFRKAICTCAWTLKHTLSCPGRQTN